MSLREKLDLDRIPKHIAVIMDGNGRWAKKQGFLRAIGHENGVTALRRTSEAAVNIGVRYLTVYAFSSENWNRPKLEVNAIMSLMVSSLRKELQFLQDNDTRLEAIGKIQNLPKKCRRELAEVMEKTKNNKSMVLTVALSYGSKEEIFESAKKMAQKVIDENLTMAGMKSSETP